MADILVSVHDVSPRHAERLRLIDETLDGLGLRGRYSMLVVPDFWRRWSLEAHPEFGAWLRARANEGVEMILHGFSHQDETEHRSPLQAWKARTMTAGEGEFLGLSYEDARPRLRAGRAMVESVIEKPVEGFVAPAWLYSEGTRAALTDEGFHFAEDHRHVWDPQTGRVALRGPVVSYASRDRWRVAGSLLWSRTSTILLRGQETVRFAIHPHDLDVPVLFEELLRALSFFCTNRKAVLYHERMARRA